MLTYRQLNDLPRSVVRIMTEAEQSIIDDMARRIARLGKVTASTEWQLKRLEALGVEEEVIIKRLRAALGKSEQQLIALFDEAATRSLEKNDGIYKAAGYDPILLKDNPQMQQILRVGYAEVSTLLANLTRTTASTATHQFERALDLAYTQIVTGGMDYQTAIKRAVRSLAQRGLSTVNYASGHADALDVAVRRAVMTGVSQTVGKLQMQRAQEMGQDLMELTAHAGARPTHAVWQGKLVSLSGRPGYLSLTDIGYGDPAGFKGVNCGHDWYPYFEGLSEPAYTPEQLRQYNDRTVKYDGKEMDLYDATQHQRYIERQIRRWKRESSALDAAGLDNSYARGKVSQWQATQRDFIRQTGLRRDYFRERAGKQNLDVQPKSGIISLDKAGRESFAKKDYADVKNLRASNLAVRQWYNYHTAQIPDQIDRSLSIEDQARQAHGLRNTIRRQARDLMADQAARAHLDLTKPNETFEQTLARKMVEKRITRDQALMDIISTATKTNAKVNQKLGVKE